MVNESSLKTAMTKDVRIYGGYARRFEDRFGLGLVDCVFIPKGLPPIFAEVKLVEGYKFGPSDRRYVELQRINEHIPHAYAIVIGVKNGINYFTKAVSQADIRECFSVTTSNISFNQELVQFYHAKLKG